MAESSAIKLENYRRKMNKFGKKSNQNYVENRRKMDEFGSKNWVKIIEKCLWTNEKTLKTSHF